MCYLFPCAGLPAATESDSHAILDSYIAAGGNFIDTANIYNTSEVCIGRWLAKREKADPTFRQSIIIATKVTRAEYSSHRPLPIVLCPSLLVQLSISSVIIRPSFTSSGNARYANSVVCDPMLGCGCCAQFGGPMGSGPNERGGSRKHIEDSIAASLRNLQTSYIDLYQVHFWALDTPLTEQMFALDSLVRRGQVRYVGCSNFTSWQLNEANRIVQEHHLTPFVTLQQQYSLLCRTLEWDIIDVLEKDRVGILPWSPLAGGWLSGKYKRGSKQSEGGSRVEWAGNMGGAASDFSFSANANEHAYGIIDQLDAIGKEIDSPWRPSRCGGCCRERM